MALGYPRPSRILPSQRRILREGSPEDGEKPNADYCRENQKRDPDKPAPARDSTVWIIGMGRFAIIAVAGTRIMATKDRRPPSI